VDPIRRGYGYRISWALALPVSTVGIVMGWMLGMVFLPRFLPAEASVMFYGLFGLVPGGRLSYCSGRPLPEHPSQRPQHSRARQERAQDERAH
jgi:hypothetical protein